MKPPRLAISQNLGEGRRPWQRRLHVFLDELTVPALPEIARLPCQLNHNDDTVVQRGLRQRVHDTLGP